MKLIPYGILSLCLIGFANSLQYLDLFIQNCNATVDFECVSSDPTSVIIYGQTMKCSSDEVCNNILENDCSPCIKKSTTCYDKFKCNPNDKSQVILNSSIVYCRENYACNDKFVEPCNFCVMVPCSPENVFTCNDNDDQKVTIGNFDVVCNDGFVCNKNKLQPCTPCISVEDLNANTNDVETTTTTTTTTPQVVEEEPDCNDGSGMTKPCRPSLRTNGTTKYYYRCKSTYWWFKTALTRCDDKDSDLKCKDNTEICR